MEGYVTIEMQKQLRPLNCRNRKTKKIFQSQRHYKSWMPTVVPFSVGTNEIIGYSLSSYIRSALRKRNWWKDSMARNDNSKYRL